MKNLILSFLLFFIFITTSLAEVISIDVGKIAATQSEVGSTAVTKMMVQWAESGGTPEGFQNYLMQKIVTKPFPGVSGPSLWEEGSLRTYILDGHHRASAFNRILHQEYDALPDAVKKVMTREMQSAFRNSSEMRLHIDVQKSFASADELVKDFALSGRGQLPAAIRSEPTFQKAMEKLKLGEKVDLSPIRRGYSQMAGNLSNLRDSPLRSAVGNAFYGAGINSDKMIHYIEFYTAEKIEGTLRARGIVVNAANATSPEVAREVQKAILGNSDLMKFLKNSPRVGEEAQNLAMLEAAESKFHAARIQLPTQAPTGCGAGFQLLGR